MEKYHFIITRMYVFINISAHDNMYTYAYTYVQKTM